MINFVNTGLDEMIVKSVSQHHAPSNHEGEHVEYRQTKGENPHRQGYWVSDGEPSENAPHPNQEQQHNVHGNQSPNQRNSNQQPQQHNPNQNQNQNQNQSSNASQSNSHETNSNQGNTQHQPQPQQNEQSSAPREQEPEDREPEPEPKPEPIGWRPRPYAEYREQLDDPDPEIGGERNFILNGKLKKFVDENIVPNLIALRGVRDWQNRPLIIDGTNPHHFFVKCETRFADFMEQKYREEELSKIRPKLDGWDARDENAPQEIKDKYKNEFEEKLEGTVRKRVLENAETGVRELAKEMIETVKRPKIKREGRNFNSHYAGTEREGTTEFIGSKVTVVVAHSGKVMTFYPTSLDKRLALGHGWRGRGNAARYMETYIRRNPHWLAGYSDEQREFLKNRIDDANTRYKEQYFSEMDFIDPPPPPINEESLSALLDHFRSLKLYELQRKYVRSDYDESFYKCWSNRDTFVQ